MRNLFPLTVLILLFSCVNPRSSTTSTNSQVEYEMKDMGDYIVVPLTPVVKEELGDIRKFQVFLSSSLLLDRMEKSGQNKGTDDGQIQRIHDKYQIEFGIDTPGMIRDINYYHDSPYSPKPITSIVVYFDTSESSTLTFVPYSSEETGQQTIYKLEDGYSGIYYEGRLWSRALDVDGKQNNSDIYLVLHLDKDIYERLFSKKAKGRVIPE